MIFHLGFELPQTEAPVLDSEAGNLTPEEFRILRAQIQKNSVIIDDHISRLELFVNKEKYPPGETFLHRIRKRLELLMEENDTFRKVVWRHVQSEELLQGACRP